jgi:FGGY-family pentulose kinase
MSGQGPLFLGLDGGTGGARALLTDATGDVLAMATSEYDTWYPHPGWAEQSPAEWWRAAVLAIREAVRTAGVSPDRIAAICADGTSSTVVCLDQELRPTRDAILWMDNRASVQAQRILETGDPALRRSQTGVSSEWMIPRLLWLKEEQPEIFERSRWFVEMADYFACLLSGRLTLGLNQITNRWFYDGRKGGWPTGFFDRIGLGGIAAFFPTEVLPLGAPIGRLCPAAAEALGLTTATMVVCGGTDAYVAMLGLNVCRPGETAFITGSSTLVLPVTDRDVAVPGIFGPHPDCVVPGLFVMEGGQVSSGSILKWWNDQISGPMNPADSTHAAMMRRAEAIPLGADGLVALDFWQGNRNPYTDYDLQGAIWGLTLKHTPDHILRALLESIAFGTENILRVLAEGGVPISSMTACGGSTRSRFTLQMHADVSGLPIAVTKVSEATVFGAAIAAAVGFGAYANLTEAAAAMVRQDYVVEPNRNDHERYGFYFDCYRETHAALKPLMHDMARRRPKTARSAAGQGSQPMASDHPKSRQSVKT